MTQTTTDYLFQLTGPATDRTFGAAGSSGGAGTFDDHLSQASTIAGDETRNIGNRAPRSDPPRYNDPQPDQGSYGNDDTRVAAAAGPAVHVKEDSGPARTPQQQNETAEAANDKRASTADVDRDEHDADKSDETAAVEVAVAGQAGCDQPQKQVSKTPLANTTLSLATRASSPNEKAATHSGDPEGANHAHGRVANNGAPSPEAAAQHVGQAAKLVAADVAIEPSNNLPVAIDEAEQPHDAAADVNQSKAEKTSERRPKSKLEANATDEDATRGKPSLALAGNGEISPDAVQNATDHAQVKSTLSVPNAANGASDADASSEDEPRRGSRDDASAGVRNDGAGQTNKADAALVATGATNTADAAANIPSKNEKGEQITKPITAKGESAAATFARLSRTGTGASRNGPTASDNDAPRVDPSRFVGRVAKAFQTAQERGGVLQLRLSPPELGSLRLELMVKDGVMSAALQTENANARRLLLDHLPALRDRLAEQNIRVERFDVDVRREGTGSQSDTRGSQQEQFQHQPEQPAPRRQAPVLQRELETVPQDIRPVAPSASDAGLNLIV